MTRVLCQIATCTTDHMNVIHKKFQDVKPLTEILVILVVLITRMDLSYQLYICFYTQEDNASVYLQTLEIEDSCLRYVDLIAIGQPII